MGPPSSRAGRGRAARPRPTRARAGRAAVRSPPPQLGHTFDRTASTQSRQNVHSYEQIIASVTLGASRRLQFSQVGRSSSMSHYARERSHTDRPGGSTRDRPTVCAIERANVGWRGTSSELGFDCRGQDRPCRARPADGSLVAEDRSAGGVRDQTVWLRAGPWPGSRRARGRGRVGGRCRAGP